MLAFSMLTPEKLTFSSRAPARLTSVKLAPAKLTPSNRAPLSETWRNSLPSILRFSNRSIPASCAPPGTAFGRDPHGLERTGTSLRNLPSECRRWQDRRHVGRRLLVREAAARSGGRNDEGGGGSRGGCVQGQLPRRPRAGGCGERAPRVGCAALDLEHGVHRRRPGAGAALLQLERAARLPAPLRLHALRRPFGRLPPAPHPPQLRLPEMARAGDDLCRRAGRH